MGKIVAEMAAQFIQGFAWLFGGVLGLMAAVSITNAIKDLL